MFRTCYAVKPVYSGHLWFLRKVSGIQSFRIFGQKKTTTTGIKIAAFFSYDTSTQYK